MRAEEIAFWLEWYSDWQAALEAGARTVEVSSYHCRYAKAGFEETVLRLDALVQRTSEAPFPKSFMQSVWGVSEGEERADESDEGSDWPAPGIAAEAAAQLRTCVREPYVYAAGDPSMSEIAPIRSLERLVAGVRAVQLIESGTGGDEAERTQVAAVLRDATAGALFEDAISGIDFLPAVEVQEVLARFALGPEAMTPFHRFVNVDLTLRALEWCPYLEPWDDSDFDRVDPPEPYWVCPHCQNEYRGDSDHDSDICAGSGGD